MTPYAIAFRQTKEYEKYIAVEYDRDCLSIADEDGTITQFKGNDIKFLLLALTEIKEIMKI